MPARYQTLAAWANSLGWTSGAELGVADGKTHIYLLEHCPSLALLGFDVWNEAGVRPSPTASGERCQCDYCAETRAEKRGVSVATREAQARAGVKRFGRSKLYKMRTADGATLVPDGSLDFVFVDGDHSVEGVTSDIAAWKGKIRKGGRLVGHDANMASVMQGVLAHYGAEEITFDDDHLWWVQH